MSNFTFQIGAFWADAIHLGLINSQEFDADDVNLTFVGTGITRLAFLKYLKEVINLHLNEAYMKILLGDSFTKFHKYL